MSTTTNPGVFTLDTLPSSGVLRIYATCDRVSDESAEFGTPEESGWVNSVGERTIYESRNDVRPVEEFHVAREHGQLFILDDSTWTEGGRWSDADEDARSEIQSTLESLGAYQTDDGTTLYAVDPHVDYESGDIYMYALHAHVKWHTARDGWLETPVDIRPTEETEES